MQKRTNFFPLILIATLLSFSSAVFSQDTTKVIDNSLPGQYKEMLAKSSHYQDYKVVRTTRLSLFYKNFTDSLNKERKNLAGIQEKLKENNQQVNLLRDSLTSKNKELHEAHNKLDEISLLGISMSKGGYNFLMWGLVIILALALSFVVFKSSGYRREAEHRINLYDEVADELKSFKTRANEKEKKLARELQDEINKVAELTGRQH